MSLVDLTHCLVIGYQIFQLMQCSNCVSVLSPYRQLATSKGSMWGIHFTHVNHCKNKEYGLETPKMQTSTWLEALPGGLAHFQPHNQPTNCRQTPSSNHAKTRTIYIPWPQKRSQCSSDMGTPCFWDSHPHITSELGMVVPIMPGGLGIPIGSKVLGIWGPHSDMGTPHT